MLSTEIYNYVQAMIQIKLSWFYNLCNEIEISYRKHVEVFMSDEEKLRVINSTGSIFIIPMFSSGGITVVAN